MLTGQEGSIEFKAPGTSFCLDDHTDFGDDGTTSHITVPCEHDFRVGDLVAFYETDGGHIDDALLPSTDPNRPALRTAQNGTILELGDFVGGSGYTDGTFGPLAAVVSGGTNNSARISGTVTGGEVTAVTLDDGGNGYATTDQLTANVPGFDSGGSGFLVEVERVLTVPAGVTCYFVVATGDDWIEVSGTEGGTAISMAQDGGTGTANQGTIEVELCDFVSMCGVRDFSLDISREELDTTTLPCHDGTGEECSKLAEFRTTQSGYATATGTMTVYFTCDQQNMANRLLSSSILKNQTGARTKLYVCTQLDANGNVSDTDSLFIDAFINITGMSFSVNPDDVTTAELSFSVNRMVSAFGLSA